MVWEHLSFLHEKCSTAEYRDNQGDVASWLDCRKRYGTHSDYRL